MSDYTDVYEIQVRESGVDNVSTKIENLGKSAKESFNVFTKFSTEAIDSWQAFESVSQSAAQKISGSFAQWDASAKSLQGTLQQTIAVTNSLDSAAKQSANTFTGSSSSFAAWSANATVLQADIQRTTEAIKSETSEINENTLSMAAKIRAAQEAIAQEKATEAAARASAAATKEQAATSKARRLAAEEEDAKAALAAKALAAEHKALTDQGRQVSATMQVLGASTRGLLIPMQSLGVGLGGAGQALQSTAGSMTNMGYASMAASTTGLAPLVVVLGVTTAAVVGLGAATALMAIQWQNSMTQIEIATGRTREELQGLYKDIQDTAKDTGTSPEKIAGGYAAVIPGLELYNHTVQLTNEQNKALIQTASELANVTGTDEKAAFEALTGIVTAFNIPFEKIPEVGDKLFKTWQLTGISLTQLSDTMGRVVAKGGPVAQNLDDIATVLVTASAAGLRGGKALESVNAAIEKLAAPSEELNTKVRNLGEGMAGWANSDIIGRLELLGNRWHDLGDKVAVANEAENLFGERGQAVATLAAALTNHLDDINTALGTQGGLHDANLQKQKDINKEWEAMWTGITSGLATAGVGVGTFFDNFGTRIHDARTAYQGLLDDLANNSSHTQTGGKGGGTTGIPFNPVLDLLAAKFAGDRSKDATDQANLDAIANGIVPTPDPTDDRLDPKWSGNAPGFHGPTFSPESQQRVAQQAIDAQNAALGAKHDKADYKAEYKAAGDAAKDFYDFIDVLNRDTTKSTDAYKASEDKALTAVDNLAEAARQRGVPAAKEYADALKQVIQAGIGTTSEDGVLKYVFDPAKLQEAGRLLRTLGNDVPEKKPSSAPPAETTQQRLSSLLGSNLASSREEAGPAGPAITQLEQSIQERNTTLQRTGKDTAVGAAQSAVSAIQKIYQDATKAGIDGASEMFEELKPFIVRAFSGDDSAQAEIVARLTSLGQAMTEAAADKKWQKSLQQAVDETAAHNRQVQDQMLLDTMRWHNQERDETDQHNQKILEIQSAAAVKELEIHTKLGQALAAEDRKYAQQQEDARTTDQRKREDLATKFADEDSKLTIKKAADDAKIVQEVADKTADNELKFKRKREDNALGTKREIDKLTPQSAGGLFGNMSGGSFGNTGGTATSVERDKILAKAKQDEEDLKTEEKRAAEDLVTEKARKKRDETSKLGEEEAVRNITRAAELKSLDTVQTRKMEDLSKEAGRRKEEITQRTTDETDLANLVRSTQESLHADAMTKEDQRHDKVIQHLQDEKDLRETSQGLSDSRDEESRVAALKRENPGKSEDEIRALYEAGVAAQPAKSSTPPPATPPTSNQTSPSWSPYGFGGNTAPGIHDYSGYASGGAFDVTGYGGTDSTMVRFAATPGERVSISPGGGGGGSGGDMSALAAAIQNRPIVVYLDGKQLETSLTRRQIQTIESRTSVGGRF